MLSRIAVFALELLIVTLAVLLGAEIASEVRIIPKALLHLPQIDFSPADTRTVLFAYLGFCGLTLLANRFISGWDVFASARRAAKEVYALLTGIVAAALYLFFLTAITFSPELLLDATLIAILLLLIAFVAFCREETPARRAGGFVKQTFALLAKPAVWLVVLFALSPLAVAWKFTTDRDFANWVTGVRVAANLSDDHPYVLVNALGSTLFETPIMMRIAKGDSRTVYVLTRNGEIWRADYPSGAGARKLLDIRDRVGFVEMENGALGFDLHPDFRRNGFAYIYFTEYRTDGQTNRLSRFTLTAPNPAATALPLIEQRRNNDGYHNAGSVDFGPGGFLYLSVGEASMRRCHQRIDCALVGGILRLDVDRRGGAISRPITRQPTEGTTANYFIPLDNPYANQPDALGEFWAHGLRNPFRISFDSVNGNLWAGDVGSTVWEEVNRIERGANYQFPYIEGRTVQENYPRPARVIGREAGPVITYRHTAYLRSVIGGLVYRGDRLPELRGRYIFTDNYSGEILTIPGDATRAEGWEVIARAKDVAQRGATGFITAPDGQILISVMGDNDNPTGMIAKLVKRDSEEARSTLDAQAREKAAKQAAAIPGGYGATKAGGATTLTSAQARSLYNVNCARCHGASGKGDGPDSEELGAFVPDFTDPKFHQWRTDAEIMAVLKGGGAAVGQSVAMPPWEGVLNPDEMIGVKDYVRSFKPE